MPISALSFLKRKRFITDYRKKNGISVPGHKNFFSEEIKMKICVSDGFEQGTLCVLGTRDNLYTTRSTDANCVNFLNKFLLCVIRAPGMWHLCVVTGRLFNASNNKNLYLTKKLARNLRPSNQPP